MTETRALTGPSRAAVQIALERALNDVLERMFFVEPVHATPESEHSSPGIEAYLPYAAGVAGWLRLHAAGAAARALAADFLGSAEEDLAQSTVEEVFCELANMICGAALSRLEPSAAIRLGQPRIAVAEAPSGAPLTSCSVATGRGTVTASLSTEEPACMPDERRGS